MCEDKINARVKGKLPRTAPIRQRKKSTALTFNCCSRIECCRVTKRHWATNVHAADWLTDWKKKPAWSLYGFHCMAHAIWLDKKYAIFENYTQCSSLAQHMPLSFFQHSETVCSAATGFERKRARGTTLWWAHTAERDFASLYRKSLNATSVEFSSSLAFDAFRRVRKNLNSKQKVNSTYNQPHTTAFVYLSERSPTPSVKCLNSQNKSETYASWLATCQISERKQFLK